MSTTFKIRVTHGREQHIVGDYEDSLMVQELSARWFNADWEAATGLYLETREGTTGSVVEGHYGLKHCMRAHRDLIVKMLSECSRRNAAAAENGMAMSDDTDIPSEAFKFLELIHKAIRLMEMFEAIGMLNTNVTVFWS